MEKTRKYSNFHIYVYVTQQKFNKFRQINDRILFIWKNVNIAIFIYIRIYMSWLFGAEVTIYTLLVTPSSCEFVCFFKKNLTIFVYFCKKKR